MIKMFKRMETILAMLAGVALLAMMVLSFCDVVGRYGFNKSIFGTAEYVELLMVIAIFAGVAFVTASDSHIKVEIFEPLIARRFPRLQRWTVLIFSIAMYLTIAIELTCHAIDSFESGRRTAVLNLPQWFLPGAAAAFSILGVILFIVAITATNGQPLTIGEVEHFDHAVNDGSKIGVD